MTPNPEQKLLLLFTAAHDIELPPEVRQQCRTLLVELLIEIVRAERMTRRPADD